MDKKSLNNEIVKMRPEANKAKVHTISKLNREVKRLRVQKSYQPEAVKQKNHQKAERLVEELLLIKKLRHDEITKFALSHSKSAASAILSNPRSSQESRCLSRLALHMGLATRVETFRTQFPNWETTLVTLMASIGVKVKRSKVIAKSLALLKPTVKLDDNDDVEDTSDGINDEEESNTKQVHSDTSDDSEEEEIEADSDSETDSNSVFNEVTLGQQVESDGSDEKSLRDSSNTRLKHIEKDKRVISNAKKSLKRENDKVGLPLSKKKELKRKAANEHASSEEEPKPHVNLKKDCSLAVKSKKQKTCKNVKEVNACEVIKSGNSTANKQVKTKVVVTRSKEMKVMRFTELLGLNTSMETPIENNEQSSKLATKTVDSFFVTEDGKSEFLSTVPIKDPIVEQKAVNNAPQEVYDSSGRRLNRREIRSRLHGKSSFKGFSSRPSLNKNNYNNKWSPVDIPATSKWKDNAAQLQAKIFLPPVVDEPLHPSWEAKKKQKEQLNIVFQGKKITFDD